MTDISDFFGEPISTYSRAQALEDGFLIDVTDTAREAGIKWPVALTAAVWDDCVAWSAEDNARKGIGNDEAGRLWDVIYCLFWSAQRTDASTLTFSFRRVPREGLGRMPRLVTLKAVCGPGDDPAPVITVMLPTED